MAQFSQRIIGGNTLVVVDNDFTFVIDTTNNRVGVKTTAPVYVFDVDGDFRSTGNIYANSDILISGTLQLAGTNLTATATELNLLDGASLTANEFMVANPGGTSFTTTSVLQYDSANQRIGIGTGSPQVKLDMVSSTADETQFRMEQANDTADAPDVRTYKARGTVASKTAVADDDYLFGINSFAYNGSSYVRAGSLLFRADGTAGDGYFTLSTTQGGTSSVRLATTDSGAIRISDAFTLPTSDGSANQALTTDGSGAVSWGSFATTAQGALADTALQTVAVDGVTITGDGAGIPLSAVGGGGGGVSIGDAVGGGTAGSLLFVDASGNLAQDNTQLFWDNTNNRLGIGTATPAEALVVAGNVVIEDPSSTGTTDHLLEVKSASSSTPDNARILISADTDAKLPMLHLRDIEANGGTFNGNYSAYMALDRATPVVTGSAQNDLLIANGNLNKDIHFCTNNTGNGSQAQARLTIVGSDGDVGIGTTSPSQKLHVVGTIRQTNSTNAVLVSNASGDIGSASNLQDIAYSDGLYADNTGMYPLTPPAPSAWGGPPPATLNEAIDRLAAALYNISGPIS